MALYVPEVERPVKECLICGSSHGTLRLFQLEDPRERLDIGGANCVKGDMAGKMYDARTKTWIVPTLYFQDVNPPEHRKAFYLHYNCSSVWDGYVPSTSNLLQCKPTYAYKAVAKVKKEVKVLIKEKLGKKFVRKFDSLLKPHPKFFCNIRTHTTKSGCEWHCLTDYCWWVQQIVDKFKDQMDDLVFQVASVVNPPESYRMRKQAKKPRKASVKPRRESIDPTLLWQLDAGAIQTIYDFLFLDKEWDWSATIERVRPDRVILRRNIIGEVAKRYIDFKHSEGNLLEGYDVGVNKYLKYRIRQAIGIGIEFSAPQMKRMRVKYTSPEANVKTSHSSA